MASSNGRGEPGLTITAAGAEALAPHVRQAWCALRCVAAMHAAAGLPTRARHARLAARELAALQGQLDALAAGAPARAAQPRGEDRSLADRAAAEVRPGGRARGRRAALA